MTGVSVRSLLISAAFVVAGATAATAQDTLYRLIELEADGSGSTKAYALNNTGQIVGWMESGSDRHAAHWHVETTTDLHGTVHFALEHPYDLYDQGYSEAFDISNADQIVGTARTEVDCPPTVTLTNAFLLRPAVLTDLATPYPGDALTNLHTLGSPCPDPNTYVAAFDSAATGISNSNHVVGWADRIDGSTHAVITVPVDGQFYVDDDGDLVNDLIVDLGTLRGDTDPISAATAVNDSGRITGYSYTLATIEDGDPRAAYHAFLITPRDTDGDGIGDQWYRDVDGDNGNDRMRDLGTLGGYNSWGRDINNENQVVGESDTDPDESGGYNLTRAFLWDGGDMSDLGALVEDGFSAASAINDDGVIVGWSGNDDGQRRAIIYENGEMTDLNDLVCTINEEGITFVPGVILTEARDVNEDGWIVGWGQSRTSSSTTRGFLLIPIDPTECEAAEQDDDSTSDSDTTTDGGGTVDGDTIIGTPGTLDGSTADDTADGDDTTTAATLCGFGAATVAPLMLVGLCIVRLTTGRRLSRRG
jgi:probable HAF family extracellular repeat protein